MASILKVDELQGIVSAGDITITGEGGTGTMQLQQGLAKAWFIFDQVNSNTLDNSLNISTMTDRGNGSIYGNFTNSMDSVDYVTTAASSPVASGSMTTLNNNRSCISSADTTSKCSINIFQTATVTTFSNEQNQQGLVHGDLA